MRFAHIADCHLGAFRDKALRELNFKAFERALEMCMEEKVDFVLICGDIFHNPLPSMDIVRRAVDALMTLHSNDIPVYAVFGSHDFSPGTSSLLDVLGSAKVFKKAVNFIPTDEGGRLESIVDEGTGVHIAGLSGLKGGKEGEYYSGLDLSNLSDIESDKIFAFHTTVSELKPAYIPDKYSIPLSLFPKGFNYYAGGHIHEPIMNDVKDMGWVVYPGAPFGSSYTDLEMEVDRGFVIVEDWEPRMVPLDVAEFNRININAEGCTPAEVSSSILEYSKSCSGKVVLLKIKGILRSGRPGDVGFPEIRQAFLDSGALTILVNRYGLSSSQVTKASVSKDEPEVMESRILEDMCKDSAFSLDLCQGLLSGLRHGKDHEETQEQYNQRIWEYVGPVIERWISSEKNDEIDPLASKKEEKEVMEPPANKKEKDDMEKDDHTSKIQANTSRKEQVGLFDFGGEE